MVADDITQLPASTNVVCNYRYCAIKVIIVAMVADTPFELFDVGCPLMLLSSMDVCLRLIVYHYVSLYQQGVINANCLM